MPVAGEDLSSGIPTDVPTLIRSVVAWDSWKVKWYILGRDGFLFHGGYSTVCTQAGLLAFAQLHSGCTKATDCLTWGLDGLLGLYTSTVRLT